MDNFVQFSNAILKSKSHSVLRNAEKLELPLETNTLRGHQEGLHQRLDEKPGPSQQTPTSIEKDTTSVNSRNWMQVVGCRVGTGSGLFLNGGQRVPAQTSQSGTPMRTKLEQLAKESNATDLLTNNSSLSKRQDLGSPGGVMDVTRGTLSVPEPIQVTIPLSPGMVQKLPGSITSSKHGHLQPPKPQKLTGSKKGLDIIPPHLTDITIKKSKLKKPNLDKTRRRGLKNPRMIQKHITTESNAVTNTQYVRFAVTSPTGYISKVVSELIETEMEKAMLCVIMTGDSNAGTIAFCDKTIYKDGCLHLTGSNLTTLNWVNQWAEEFQNPNVGELVVLLADKIPKRVQCGFVLPKLWNNEQSIIGKCLKYSNPELRPEWWLLNGLHRDEKTNSTFVVVSVPEDIVPAIQEKGCQLSFLIGTVNLSFRNEMGTFVKTPPSHDFRKPNKVVTASALEENDPNGVNASTSVQSMEMDAVVAALAVSEDIVDLSDELGLQDVICDDGVPLLSPKPSN